MTFFRDALDRWLGLAILALLALWAITTFGGEPVLCGLLLCRPERWRL